MAILSDCDYVTRRMLVSLGRSQSGPVTCWASESMRDRDTNMRNRTTFVLVVAAITTACGDATGPEDGFAGRLLLDGREYSEWAWTPNGSEIVFSTPSFSFSPNVPTRLDAITVPGGSRRTIVAAPSNGDRIIGYRFVVRNSHVYYEVSHPNSDDISFYRAPLEGGTPEKIVDRSPFGVRVAPDERMVAWVERDPGAASRLVTTDIATGSRRTYPLEHHADRVTWSPSGRTVAVDLSNVRSTAGTALQWIDLTSGILRTWIEPAGGLDIEQSRDIGWDGESPLVYVAGVDVARYSMATGARTLLSALNAPGHAIGWSNDFETAFIESNECLKWSGGIFGSDCVRWANRVDRIAWRSSVRTTVLQFEGGGPTFGRASPTGSWLGYYYSSCPDVCGGLYVVRVP